MVNIVFTLYQFGWDSEKLNQTIHSYWVVWWQLFFPKIFLHFKSNEYYIIWKFKWTKLQRREFLSARTIVVENKNPSYSTLNYLLLYI